ncbi:sigma 54 modulation/S30EA ribosomal C-terminal domain-containing protein [Actinokineospora soli]|uniref:Sigma 54 modulation/S30EA ribosomal C-terminal domain-containing protein n=1 Tax=Actinokineospora soli TaxID=1048753 RepID=A0ABW2TNM6_9PSEU
MTPTISAGPAPGRAVVTRASRSGHGCSVEDAIADMDALGYDFHLYTDSSGEDCLLHRVDGGHILSGAHGRPPWRAGDPAVLVRDDRAPWLTAEQAMARLDLSGRPFLFYVDQTDRRARLLYQRADGGYGVVVPVEVGRRPHRR